MTRVVLCVAAWSCSGLADAGRTVRTDSPAYRGETFKTRLLAHAQTRQVWGVDPAEIEWAAANLEGILWRHVRLSAAEDGLRVDELQRDGIAASRGLKAGDVVRDLNGSPVRSRADLREILASPAFRQSLGLRLTVLREGKPLLLEYRPLPK